MNKECVKLKFGEGKYLLACEQALEGMEGEGKRTACVHASNFTIPPFFDIFYNVQRVNGNKKLNF